MRRAWESRIGIRILDTSDNGPMFGKMEGLLYVVRSWDRRLIFRG